MKALSEKCHAVTLIIFDRQLNLKAFFLNPISSVTTGGWTLGINFTTMPLILILNPNEGINFCTNRCPGKISSDDECQYSGSFKMLDHFALGFTDVRIHWETSFEPTLASSKNVVEETVMEAVRNAELSLDLDQLLFREVKIAQNVFMVSSS